MPQLNPITLLLQDKRSPATRRAYKADLVHFFAGDQKSGGDPAPATVQAFLQGSVPDIALRLATYKGDMLTAGLAEATINRRLAAVRSLLKISHRLGLAKTDGRGLVDGERSQAYRDTRGVDLAGMRRLIAAAGTETLRGLRDTAILRLMCETALRRAEVCALDVSDFEPAERRIHILGKGRGTQKVPMTISPKSVETIRAYLDAAGHQEGAIFRNLDHRPDRAGGRLTTDGLYMIVRGYGKALGMQLAPHKLRHSAITAALDATDGNVRKVQRLSRHAKLETLQKYDDNRSDFQGEVTGLLSGLL